MPTIQRALISVTDKTGIVEFARVLAGRRIEILSTGGTAKALREAGIEVREVSDFTGFPEMLDGRVKTLHPKIHGGLLGRRDLPDHQQQMARHQILPIDLVCINLYRFEATVAKPGVTLEEAIENIDIGGPSMVRSAAKNHSHVSVITDPADYAAVGQEIASTGEVSVETNRQLAAKAFALTASYDSAIADYLSKQYLGAPRLTLGFTNGRALRYGENAHQSAAFYDDPRVSEPNLSQAVQRHGKELSFNNLVDADAALEAVKELWGNPAAAIIKHTNPCGYATGATLAQALEAAWQGDPVSAFGSVIAVSTHVDKLAADRLKGRFVEIIIAPSFSAEAVEFLSSKSKDIRLLEIPGLADLEKRRQPNLKVYRPILGGMLEQDRDSLLHEKWEIKGDVPFPEAKRGLAEFTWKAAKHTKSNAIVLGWEYEEGRYMVIGMGAGQPNRVDSLRKLAVTKAHENWKALRETPDALIRVPEKFETLMEQAVLASDAFFPFADTVEVAAEYGIRFILQPGGSKRDSDVVAAAGRHGIALVFTGTRHFRH